MDLGQKPGKHRQRFNAQIILVLRLRQHRLRIAGKYQPEQTANCAPVGKPQHIAHLRGGGSQYRNAPGRFSTRDGFHHQPTGTIRHMRKFPAEQQGYRHRLSREMRHGSNAG